MNNYSASFGEDRRLLSKIISGDGKASEDFVRRFSNLVYRAIRYTLVTKHIIFSTQDLEDLHNTVFLNFFEQGCKKLRQYEGKNGCSLGTWIRIVAVRIVLNHLRKKGVDALTWEKKRTALDEIPGPRKDPEAEKEGEEEKGRGRRGRGWRIPNPFSFLSSGKEKEEKEKPPLRLSVLVVDGEGNTGKVLLNRYGPVRRPIEIRISRRDDQQYLGNTEMVLQSYSIPLEDFLEASGGKVDLSRLAEVHFLFDESPAGSLILDEVGFSKMNPAFLAVSGSGEG